MLSLKELGMLDLSDKDGYIAMFSFNLFFYVN